MDARLRRRDCRLGVEVFRRRHRDDVEVFIGKHLAVVAVRSRARPRVSPVLLEALDPGGVQVASGDDLDFRHVADRPDVGDHHPFPEWNVGGHFGLPHLLLDDGGQVLGRQLADGDRPQPDDSQSVFVSVQLSHAP